MGRYKVAIIGCGARAVAYAGPYTACGDVDVVAMADPSRRHREVLRKDAGLPRDVAEYDDWREMLKGTPELDGAVVCSPTAFHVDQTIACFERGLPVALEKPIATSKTECERLLAAERSNGGRTLIGFVLRSTPFYARVHGILSEGRIGRIVSIQADELPGWYVSSLMFRSPWRRHDRLSGGSMLEKCCHDMDVLNWLAGSRPTALNSFGGLRIFTPNPELPATCGGCAVASTCRYFREDPSEPESSYTLREDYACVYNIDKSVMDVQSVSLEYENGVVANFLMNFHASGKRSGRNLHIVGTRGRLWGNLEMNEIEVHDNLSDTHETQALRTDGSGHGGGDRLHALLLARMMESPEYRPDQDLQAGYLSAVMSFASDVSVRERRRVEFRYRDDGYVGIH